MGKPRRLLAKAFSLKLFVLFSFFFQKADRERERERDRDRGRRRSRSRSPRRDDRSDKERKHGSSSDRHSSSQSKPQHEQHHQPQHQQHSSGPKRGQSTAGPAAHRDPPDKGWYFTREELKRLPSITADMPERQVKSLTQKVIRTKGKNKSSKKNKTKKTKQNRRWNFCKMLGSSCVCLS
jgi:hypothetical protein